MESKASKKMEMALTATIQSHSLHQKRSAEMEARKHRRHKETPWKVGDCGWTCALRCSSTIDATHRQLDEEIEDADDVFLLARPRHRRAARADGLGGRRHGRK